MQHYEKKIVSTVGVKSATKRCNSEYIYWSKHRENE
jgi:hypothetical protein